MWSRTIAKSVALLVFIGLGSCGWAQVGTGPWTAYTASKSLQQAGNVYYNNSYGVETFRLNDADARRSEIQQNNKWGSGIRQFEGYVRCTGAPRSAGNSVQQVMRDGDPDSDVNQVRYYSGSGGTLKVLQGSTLATGIYGVWMRVNTIHYTGSDKVVTYANGSLKSTVYVPDGSTFYFKYGIYIAGSSGRPQAEWKGIRNWYK